MNWDDDADNTGHGKGEPGDDFKNAASNGMSMQDFDVTEFLPHLDEFSLSYEQKVTFLRLIWDMMRIFVELHIPAADWRPIMDTLTRDPKRDDSPDDDDLVH